MNETVISVKDVSMMFNLSRDKVLGLKEYVVRALQRKLYYDEFWALKNISFEVNRGEVIGVIGLNGSGKSTLLKIIAGVFKPTQGKVIVNGDVSPLLELGAGFDPEFSAKDNVFYNGAMFGRSPKHMENLYDEIINFAELREFENVPVKNFSSGMQARLGFAVATSVTPDVLILDEVMGVGDYRFKNKCTERINTLLSGGATVLIVSHATSTIKSMCSRAVYLQKGELVCVGDVNEVCQFFEKGGSIT